jgi:hypothetical protein
MRLLSLIPSSVRSYIHIAECLSVAGVVGVQSRCVLLGLGCRLVGACVLGQVADGSKQGRKGTLYWSMALIGMTTLLMAALPHGAFKGGRGHWPALVLVALQGDYQATAATAGY